MSRTISNTLSTGILLGSSDSPVTVTSTGRISDSNPIGAAIYGPQNSVTISNSGTLIETDTAGGGGIYLGPVHGGNPVSLGVVTNQSGGRITSAYRGVYIYGSGAITNIAGGTITSSAVAHVSAVDIAFTGTIVNGGFIGAGYGAVGEGSGSVTNLLGGTITGAVVGVFMAGSGTVTNAGTISGATSSGTYAGAVYFGSSSSKLIVDPGASFTGLITNGPAAGTGNTIELASAASAGTLAGFNGSSITNFGTLTFDNGADWTVSGTSAASGLGTIAITGFTAGDTIDLTGFSSTSITRTFSGNALTVTNGSNLHATLHIQGSFSATNFTASSDGSTGTDIVFGGGAPSLAYGQTAADETGVTAASETVTAGILTLKNAGGTVVGTTVNVGTSLSTGDFLVKSDGSGGTDVIVDTVFGTYSTGVTLSVVPTTIASTGSIHASAGSALTGAGGAHSWTVSNYGTISASGLGHVGVQIGLAATFASTSFFTNQSGGLVSSADFGVALDAPGTVVNQAGGSIVTTNTVGSNAVYVSSATLVNGGVIRGGASGFGSAVYSTGGGPVTNLSTGTITGGAGGVFFQNTFGTLTNAGTIISTGTYGAVQFNDATAGNRLIVDPGAVFSGKILTSYASQNVVELASAASAGTLAGFNGTSITNFGTLQFDTGAAWTVTGTSASSGLGTIDITGFTAGDTIDLTGFSSTGISKTFAANALTITNGSALHATLHIQGSFSSGNFTTSSDGATGTDIVFGTAPPPTLIYGQTLDEAGIVAATETVTAGVMTLKNGGGTAVGTVAVGTSLSTGDFILRPDGSGGTDVIVNTVFGTYTGGITLLTNPTTIAATGRATNTAASGSAVAGPTGTAWTLVNDGLVSETASSGVGVSVAQSGTITNASGGTINGTSFGIAFSSTASSGMVTNQSGGVINGASNAVYFRAGSGAGTVSNSGTIATTGTTAFAGVDLSGGGIVSNASGGTITGQFIGIQIRNGTGGTVSNTGSIGATVYDGVWLVNAGTVTNASGGTITGAYSTNAAGIYLQGGGSVSNQSSGLIGGLRGVYALTVAATVLNSGHINGSGTTIGAATAVAYGGVYLGAGGSVTNNSGGTISGYAGVNVKGAAATVVNAGLITGNQTSNHAYGVTLAAGGSVTNQSGGTVTGHYGIFANNTAATVVNAGRIAGNYTAGNAVGISFAAGGSVTNQSGGTISGRIAGVHISGASGTVDNLGRIESNPSASGGDGLDLAGGGVVTNGASGGLVSTAFIGGYQYGIQFGSGNASTLTNFGTISGLPGGVGISMVSGLVVNGPSGDTGALINAGGQDVVFNGAGTLVNYGTITGGGSPGYNYPTWASVVDLAAPATISNLGSAALISAYYGLRLAAGSTVINAGTIRGDIGPQGTGTGGAAIVFVGGASRLIVDPGATFISGVYGGSSAASVVELASGASAGALTGFGTTITNFGSLVFDTGAQWTVAGNDAANGLGTLGISGFTFGDTIDLTGFAAVSRTFASNSLVLTNGTGAHETLAIQGTFNTANVRITNDGGGGTDISLQPVLIYGETIDEAGIVAASETVTAGVMTLMNGGNTTVGTVVVGDSLSTGDFILTSDGSGGTDVIVNTVFGTYASGVTLLTNPTTIAGSASITNGGSPYNALVGPSGTAWTVTNLGTIAAGNGGTGVDLLSGGDLTNDGTIVGGYFGWSVYGTGAPLTVTNNGLILDNLFTGGVSLQAGGTIINTGTILESGVAVTIASAGGTLINTGTLRVTDGSAVILSAGTAINSAVIQAGGTYAAIVSYGANITNLAGGTISGAGGIRFTAGSNGTINNSGTIIGTSGTAVAFLGTGSHRLVDNPGAVFTGAVYGGSSAASVVEFASAASAGTLAGFGSSITNFASLVFDTGAQWTVTGNDSANGLGTLGITGFTFGDTIDLTGFAAVSRTFASNSLVLTDGGGVHETLAIQGTFATGNVLITNDGSGGTDITEQPLLLYAQTIDEAGTVAASETVTAGVMTLKNGGGTVLGSVAVGTSLSTGDFSLQSDGSGGTDVVVHTATGTYASALTLLVNPTTIGSAATVTNAAASGAAVIGPTGTAWTLTNLGTIAETGASSGIGISFAASGTIINAGSVSENSTINGASAISLAAGGNVTNQSGGIISGRVGVWATGAAAGVVNAGSIGANGTLTSTGGVVLSNGGSVTNQSGGTITGFYAIWGRSTAISVVNQGNLVGNTANILGAGLFLAVGGSLTNAVGAVLTGFNAIYANGASTVVNAGNIGGVTSNSGAVGADLKAGGSLTNQSGGTITGFRGVYSNGASVLNAGSIGGNATASTAAGVLLSTGGPVTNQSGGTISGFFGVYGKGSAATVVNAGSIGGNSSTGKGVFLQAGGTITNQSGGSISGGADAVLFASGFTNRLVFDPGATFSGSVDGGNTIGAAHTSTLELASAASAGTLSGLGSTFTDFAGVTIDANANWTFSGTSTLAAGASLGNAGTLTDIGTLINAGTVSGNKLRLSGASLTNQSTGLLSAAYVLGVSAGGADTVVNQGTLSDSANGAVYLQASGSVTNAAGALIEGVGGVTIATNGTVENAGTIESSLGTTGVAVDFIGGNARLIDHPGAVFIGSVNGGSGGTAELELASGSSAGVILGVGTGITNFTSLVFDSGAQWTVSGNDSASGLGTLGIGGFTLGDTIDLTGFVAVSRTFASNTLVLTDSGNAHQTLHVQGAFGTNNFQIVADGSGGTDIVFGSPPAITAGATASFTGGGAPATLDSKLSVSDPGYTTLASGTVSIGSGFISGDLLNFTNASGITGSYNSANGTLTLSGTASLADYQAALDSITYSFSPSFGDPTGGGGDTSRTIDWVLNNGTVSNTAVTSTLNVVHVAPTITAGGTVTFTGGGKAVALDAGLTLSDVDSGGLLNGGTVSIGGFVSGDILSANTTGLPSISVAYNSSTGVLTLSGSDTLADYQAVLRSVAFSFSPGNGDPTDGGGDTTRTFGWMVSDGSTSNGTSNTGSSTLDTVHVAPTIVAGGTVAFAAGGVAAVLDAGLTVADADSAGNLAGATVSIGAGFISGDTLHFTNQNGITGSFNSSTGTLTLSGAASVANYQTALESISYSFTPNSGDPTDSATDNSRSIAWSVTDGVSSSAAATSTLDVTRIPPAIAGSAAGQTTTDEAGLHPFSGVTISDVNSGQTETVTVTLSNAANGTLSDLVGGTITAGKYVVTGTTLAVTAALDALVFTPAAHQVAPGSTVTSTFTIAALDSNGVSASDTTTAVIATAVNDAPVITGSVAGQTVTDEATVSPFSGVSISDIDFGQTETVMVTLSNHLNGALSNVGTGSYNASTGVYTITGTDAAVTSAADALIFTPAAHQVAPGGSVTTTFTIQATDTAGGTSSNSTTTVAATAVNDAPVISGSVAGQTVTDEATVSPFSGVSISDIDFGQTETVMVTLSNHLNGALSNVGTGSYNASTGVYTVTGTDAAVTSAVDALIFTPTPHQVAPGGSVTTSFTIQATDTAGGTSSNSTTTVAATAVNDAPVISGSVAGQTVTDEASLSPFAGVSISDVDSGQTETVTVTLSNHLHGALSNVGTGSYNASTGVYSVTGTDAAVTSAVAALIFTPAAHQVAPGGSVTTTFTIHATDTAGGTSSDSTTTVIATAVNDAPVITGAVAGQTVTDEATVSPFSGVSISDIDFGQTETVTVTLSNHLHGALSNVGTGSYNASTGVYSVTGTDAAVTSAVDALIFTPAAHQVAPGGSVTTTFTIQATDTAGGTSSNSTTTVAATAVNDAPVISGSVAGQTVTDEATVSPLAGVSISDIDFGQTETVTVTLSNHLNGALSNVGTGSYNASTGVYTITGTDAAVTSAVDALIFTPTPHQVAPGGSVTTTFTIHATDTAGGTNSNSTTTVAATAVSDSPAITGSVSSQTVTDETTVSPFSGVSISDADLGQTETVTVTLSNHLNGALSNVGTGSYDASTGVYTVTGTDSAVTAELEALVFTPTPHQVAPGGSVTTTFTIQATDTAGGTSTDTGTSVTATAATDLPVITGTAPTQATTDEAPVTPFSGVTISNPDVGQTETATITLSSTVNGTLSNLATGSYDASTGTYTVTGTDSQVTAALNALTFTPAPHQLPPGSTATTVFTLGVTDTAGATSSGITATLTTTAANDPPVITGTGAGQTATDETTITPFSAVAIQDPDLGQTETVTVTLSAAANGSLSSTVGGSYAANTGVFTVTGTDAQVTAALDAMVFTPTAHQVAPGTTVTTGFTIKARDTAGATATDSVATVLATAVNDPPSIALPPVNAGVPNQIDTNPFAGVSIVDPDVGHISTVTVTPSNAAGGVLSNLGGGSYDTTTGVYTLSGGAAAVTAALQGLVFTPAPPPPNAFTSTTSFTIAVTGPGGNASNSSINVTSAQQVLSLAATSTANDVVSASADGTSFAPPVADKSNQAVITTPAADTTYTLPTGYQAAFLGGSSNATLTDTSGGNALLVANTGNDVLVSATTSDTILGSAGLSQIEFTSGAAGGLGIGGTGGAIFLDSGHNDTLSGGSGTTTATTAGSGAVFLAQNSDASVVNSGTGNTLVGGSFQSMFQLTPDATGSAVFGGAGSVTIANAGGNNTLAGAAGATNVTTSGANTVFFGQSGAVTLLTSGANGILVGGAATSSFRLTGSATGTVLFGGSGTATIADAGSNNSIAGAAGATAATTAGASSLFFGQAGAVTLLDTGTANTIVGGTGAIAATASGAGALLFGGSGTLRFVGGSAGATVMGGSGDTTVTGGSGGTTLFGSNGGAIDYVGDAGSLLYAARTGNETLNAAGSTTNDQIFGGLDPQGRDLLIGGSGNDTIAAGSGSDTLTGGSGSNLFVFFIANGGAAANDMVVNFSAADQVLLAGYGAGAATAALSQASFAGGSTTITLSDNTTITFSDVSSVSALNGHVLST